jgi:glycosyltransferase involved in cell wall biosynthesis
LVIDFLTGIAWILVPLFSTLTLINLLTMRTVKNVGISHDDQVAILLPLRNESVNVTDALASARAQEGLVNLSIIALDDHSTDNTAQLLASQSDQRLEVFSGAELPQGWLGKNFASHQLAHVTKADFLVFIDADVRLSPKAISSSITLMKKLELDFLCPYPLQVAISWLERLVQPLLQWSWFVSVPLRFAEIFPRRSMAVANGQFFIVRRSAYLKSGGHEKIKGEVLDDLELARSLISHGYRGTVADGSSVAYCRMYQSPQELIAGYAKSQWRAFGNLAGAFLMALILIASSIAPLIAGVLGSPWGWIGFFAIVTTRLAVAAKTRSVLSTAWLHPLSAIAWIALIKYSWLLKFRGKLTWKERAL